MPSQPREWLFVAGLVAAMGLFHWARRLFWVFGLLVLPGTLAHESCHLILGLLLNGHPATFNLIPRRDVKGWVMGYVTFSNLRWYNVFFIGMAPLLLLPLAWWLMRWRLGLGPVLGWREGLAVYLIANLIYAALPSWQDTRIAARSPIGWLLLAGGLGWAYRIAQRPPTPPRRPVSSQALPGFFDLERQPQGLQLLQGGGMLPDQPGPRRREQVGPGSGLQVLRHGLDQGVRTLHGVVHQELGHGLRA